MIRDGAMKRIAQFVALTAVLLLAGQSVLAESQCSPGLESSCAQVPGCCIPASDMTSSQAGMECHRPKYMESQAAKCNQSGCPMATVRVIAPAIIRAKYKADRSVALVVVAQLPIILLQAKKRVFSRVSLHQDPLDICFFKSLEFQVLPASQQVKQPHGRIRLSGSY